MPYTRMTLPLSCFGTSVGDHLNPLIGSAEFMKRNFLKRGFSIYFLKISMFLFLVKEAHNNYHENSIIFFLNLILGILFFISICLHFYHPYLLEFKDGYFCFFPNIYSVTGKVCLRSKAIRSIKRAKQNYGSFGRTKLLPVYIFGMQDGTEHICKPGIAPGKELDEIESFFEGTLGLPISDISSDSSMVN
jgi:hypothetical protein